MNTSAATTSARADLDLVIERQGPADFPDWFESAFDVPRSAETAECDGTSIRYLRWGDPTKPGIVLTHGFMAHARCWAFIAPLLADRYHLAALDLSGMGDSGWRDSYSVEARAEETRAVAEHAGMTRVEQQPILVCHSYGGSVGLSAATNHAGFWGGLVVCDMAMVAPGETPIFQEQRAKRQARGVRPHRVYERYTDIRMRFRLAPDQPCANTFLMDYMAAHSVRQSDAGYLWKFDPEIMGLGDAREDDWWARVVPTFLALEMPKAIVHGQLSDMMSATVLDYLDAQSNGAFPIVSIPDAYHHVMLDQPLALTAVLSAILQGMCATPPAQ